MKKTIAIISTLVAAASIFTTKADAQTFTSGYFLDNYIYGYRINPAIMAEKGFFGVGIGNIEAGLKSDLGVSSLIYPNPAGDGLVTGLNQGISSEEFMSKIKDANLLGLDLNYNLFSVGARRDKSMVTFEVNVRGDAGASIPGDLFAFLKQGTKGDAYNLGTLYAGANIYGEVAMGYTRALLGNRLMVGGRVKVLVGFANAQVSMAKGDLTVSSNQISIDSDAQAKMASNLISFKTNEEGHLGVSPFSFNPSPSGFGAAVDLGIMFKPLKNLSITAGISDLGGIKWNYNTMYQAKGQFSFEGIDQSANSNLQDELNTAKEELTQLVNFSPVSATESGMESLPFTANLGVRYKLPIVRFISVGALATYHNDPLSPWYDTRAGLTVTPLKFVSVSANYGKSSFGNVCGGALSLSLLFLNLYVGADCYSGNMGIYKIDGVNIPVVGGVPYPIDSFRYKINAGLTMQFGARKAK